MFIPQIGEAVETVETQSPSVNFKIRNVWKKNPWPSSTSILAAWRGGAGIQIGRSFRGALITERYYLLVCILNGWRVASMISKAEFLGEASEAVPLAEVSHAAVSSVPEVTSQARNGDCSAAFPVF